MDRITDSGSVGCGSIPHGGTKKEACQPLFLYLVSDIRDEDSDYPEDVDDVREGQLKIREVLLILCNECQCVTVIDNLSQEHTLGSCIDDIYLSVDYGRSFRHPS